LTRFPALSSANFARFSHFLVFNAKTANALSTLAVFSFFVDVRFKKRDAVRLPPD
jgi:hypothetical protein